MINCGYQAYSAGKLFHGIDKDNTVFGAASANEMDGGYIGPIANFGPYPWDGKTLQYKRPSRNILNPHYPWFGEKVGHMGMDVYQNCQREVRVGSIAILDLKV